MSSIRVLIIDDHALIRDSLTRLLESDDTLKIIGSSPDADTGLAEVEKHKPDVVLMDIDMPGLNCFDAAQRITTMHPETRVIFVSAFSHDRYIDQALKVKARGYVTKAEPLPKLIDAIKQVSEGGVYFSDEIRSRLVADLNGVRLAKATDTTRTSTLSPRELEVLGYLAKGLSKKEIAQTMHVSVKTVEGHTERLMSKLDLHDRVHLTLFAIREGLVEA